MTLFRAIKLPSDEPVQYVGCYVLKWGEVSQPSHGFVEAGDLDSLLFAGRQALEAIEGGYYAPKIVDDLREALVSMHAWGTWTKQEIDDAKIRAKELKDLFCPPPESAP